jgi:pyrrolidone-carboxylate peptidase
MIIEIVLFSFNYFRSKNMLKVKSIISFIYLFPLITSSFIGVCFAADSEELTVEELRIATVSKVLPSMVSSLDSTVYEFENQLSKATHLTALTQLIHRHGNLLWRAGVDTFIDKADLDDRPLYWARLRMTKAIRQSLGFKNLLASEQEKLMWQFELYSRGKSDVKFNKKTDKKILITGFDPFLLDKNIEQSNPSGVAALWLDDLVLSIDGQTAEIETLILPVRFADFDQGMVEELLTPYIKNNKVDMVITVSMGRTDFDLEHYPGLRRSATAPDNLNIYTGANGNNPLIPRLKNKALKGAEFIEFSLPYQAMQKAHGEYKINDNRKVSVLVSDLNGILNDQKSVEGSGGGYLSNEVSYRSLVLRNLYNPKLAVGHIHTPRIKSFDTQVLSNILEQTKAMLSQAVKVI